MVNNLLSDVLHDSILLLPLAADLKADTFVIEYLLLHSFLIDNKYQRIMIQSLVQNFIVPLLLSTLIYFYLPTPETNLLGKFLCLK